MPLSFEANSGQSDRRVRFISRNSGYNLFLTQDEAVLSITPLRGATAAQESASQPSVIRIKTEGANRQTLIEGIDPLEAKSHYLIGRNAAGWRTDIPHYAKVHYQSIYPGIDLIYYGNQRQIEYDFRLAPGADASRIRLAIDGARDIRIDASGDLILSTPSGPIRQLAPTAYQIIDGTRHEVAARYTLTGKRKVGFALSAYDHNRELVIDPVLSYATLLGGTGTGGDYGNAITVDSSGNIYVAGYTTSTDFPTTAGALQRTFGGGDTVPLYDAFVIKINPSGTGLVYSTYLGGSGSDVATGIAVDSSGNAYVSGGTTSTNFPVSAGAYQSAFRGRQDAFAVKLDPAGAALVYSTYLGGSQTEFGGSLAIDSAGNAYVSGRTYSSNFPVTAGAFQTTLNRGVFCNECEDGFVTKLNPAGTAVIYSTFVGGGSDDFLMAMALGADGSVYLTGSTESNDFPITPGAIQATKSTPDWWDNDVFVTRLSPGGNSALYSTYLGSTGVDIANAITVDAAGNAVVVGYTTSSAFPISADAFQKTPGGDYDAFVTPLNASGSQVLYSTFIGDTGMDQAAAVALDSQARAVVTGGTYCSRRSVKIKQPTLRRCDGRIS